jgi:hypothetical protein
MNEIWTSGYVQRLMQPLENAAVNKEKISINEVFGFARSMSPDQYEALCDDLADVLHFDHMGSSAFEYDAIPNAVTMFKSNKSLRAYQAEVSVDPSHGDLSFYKTKPEAQTIYVIATPDEAQKVSCAAAYMASGLPLFLKRDADVEFAFFAEQLKLKNPIHSNPENACGWFDIQYGYMFFLNKDMFDAVRDRFEIQGDVQNLPSVGVLNNPRAARKVVRRPNGP